MMIIHTTAVFFVRAKVANDVVFSVGGWGVGVVF